MAELLSVFAGQWEVVRGWLGSALCLAGALICLAGTIGILRFPDFYTRLHGASVTDTGGAGLIIIGMALMAPSWLVLVKLASILIFFVVTSPTASHAIAAAAYSSGLQPLIGPVGRDVSETLDD